MAAKRIKFIYCATCEKPTEVRLANDDDLCVWCALTALEEEHRRRHATLSVATE